TDSLSQQMLETGKPVAALLVSLRNYLNVTPDVRKTIKADDFRSSVTSTGYPLGVLYGQLTATQASDPTDCDRLAGHPYDPFRTTTGVLLTQIDAAGAI